MSNYRYAADRDPDNRVALAPYVAGRDINRGVPLAVLCLSGRFSSGAAAARRTGDITREVNIPGEEVELSSQANAIPAG